MYSSQVRFLQKQQEGRIEQEGEGGCQWLGKLSALPKRFLLYESSEGAAIRSANLAKASRAVLGNPGGTAQIVLCLMES